MAKAKSRKVKRKTGRGNFRKVSPAAALRYLKQWASRGVTSADAIPAGPNASVQKVRYREAAAVARDYNVRLAKHHEALATYALALKEFKALGKKKVFAQGGLKAKWLRPAKPVAPSLTGSKAGGNFRRVTKAQAKAYLRGMCTRAKDGLQAIEEVASDPAARPINMSSIKATVDGGNPRTPRLQEAIMLVGPAEVVKIISSCEISRKKSEEAALKKAAAAEERKKKINKAKVMKLEREIKKCRDLIEQHEKALAGATAVADSRGGYAAGVAGLRRRARRARRTRRHAR